MFQITLDEAQHHFTSLIEQAAQGEEVVIINSQGQVFKLALFNSPLSEYLLAPEIEIDDQLFKRNTELAREIEL